MHAIIILTFTTLRMDYHMKLVEKEICRARYLLVDHFAYDNEHQSTDEQWQDYFYQFNYAAALARGR